MVGGKNLREGFWLTDNAMLKPCRKWCSDVENRREKWESEQWESGKLPSRDWIGRLSPPFSPAHQLPESVALKPACYLCESDFCQSIRGGVKKVDLWCS